MLPTYKVKYETSMGHFVELVRPIEINATTTNHDIDISTLLANVLKINKEQITSIGKVLGTPDSEIKEKDLPIVLTSLYSAAISGQNIIDELTDTISELYNNKKFINKLYFYKQQGLTITEIFKRIHLHPVIVSIVDAGVKNGDLASAFEDAEAFVNLSIETRDASKTGITKSLLYFSIGVFLVFFTPALVANFFNDMLDLLGGKTNNAIDYLNFMANNFIYISSIFGVLILIFIFIISNHNTLQITKNIPVLNNFYYVVQNKKAIVFLLFYMTLNKSGVHDEKIVTLYKNIDNHLSDQILTYIKNGKTLSESIRISNLSNKLSKSIATIINVRDLSARSKAFRGVIKMLIKSSVYRASRLSLALNIVSTIFMGIGIMAIIIPYQSLLEASL